MTKRVQDMVREFHEVFGHPVANVAENLSVSYRQLRLDLITEELGELIEASGFTDFECSFTHSEGSIQNPVEMADALGDLVYVIYGFAIAMGIDLDRVVEEIHNSNMTKLGEDGKPIYREDGKVLKGPNYRKPDITSVIFF